MNKIFFSLFFLSLIFYAENAYALGVEASPSIIKISAEAEEINEAKITVKNPSKEVSLFEIYPDEFENFISFSSSSFILESGTSKEISLQIKSDKEGIFKTNISIVANSVVPNKFNVGSGVKIPIEITITPQKNNFRFSSAAFFSMVNNSGLVLLLSSIILVFGIFRLTRKQF